MSSSSGSAPVSPAPVVLVIEDEPSIRSIIRAAVESEGAVVYEAATARTALELARSCKPSLIVLDLGLPDADGSQVCAQIREWSATPIVVLSARHDEAEKVRLLDAGADDYLTKPFSTIELQARLRAQLRRAAMGPVRGGDVPYALEGLTIDLASRLVSRDGQPIHLTPTEWELLRTLVTAAGRTLTHQQLFDAVWSRSHGDAQQYLRVYVANLRRKVERDPIRPVLILTEPGVGYRMSLPTAAGP